MSKRKPDQTITHRIELQSKERELIQDYMMIQQANNLVQSLTSMPVATMYAWLNVFEALGIFDSPIPTVADFDEIPAAIAAWAKIPTYVREGVDVGAGAANGQRRITIRELITFAFTGEYPDTFSPNGA